MTVRIYRGDCIDIMAMMSANSVHTCVTSPPYFGLRDYGVEGQIGLEETPQIYVERLVSVFSEVRRILRDDGTLWLNLGDSYAGSWGAQSHRETPASMSRNQISNHPKRASNTGTIRAAGVKSKDLYGIPWMVAFALRADGWYLRQDLIWHKPNPMPHPNVDRCVTAHEYIFLLSKSERYYFDHKAIQEPATCFRKRGSGPMVKSGTGRNDTTQHGDYRQRKQDALGKANYTGFNDRFVAKPMRNKRSVWTVTTKPFAGAHFATFPPDLIEPCILAGSPAGGCVLDPFGGAGTTGLVAQRHGRDAILCELNSEYAAMAEQRLAADRPALESLL